MKRARKPVVVALGGSDSAGCSGIQADVRTCNALGVHAATVLTAVTAQNTRTVASQHHLAPDVVQSQVEAVLADMDPGAVKVGLLGTADVAEQIATTAAEDRRPWVVDPVLRSSTGAALLPATALLPLLRLLQHATVVTPNADELSALTERPVRTPDEAEQAAHVLIGRGVAAVVAKGGHFIEHRGQDLLVTAATTERFPPMAAPDTHNRGTGCTLATALAALLAQGHTLIDAVAAARRIVGHARHFGFAVGEGPGPIDVEVGRTGARMHPLGRLHVLTDARLQQTHSHEALARQALAGGADVIQVRDKGASSHALFHAVAAVAAACEEHRAACIVNDRPDIAVAALAHGVHGGLNDLAPRAARTVIGPARWVGATAHSVAEAQAAQNQPIDYLGVGPLFGTTSKNVAAPKLGLAGLRAIVAQATVPVIAIGGIEPHQVADVIAAGAHGVAVLGGVVLADDPTAATARYRHALDEVLPMPPPKEPRR